MGNLVSHLETQLNTTTEVSQRIDLLNALAWQLRYNNVDRAIALTREAQTLAIQGEFATTPYHQGLIQSLRNLSHFYYRQGNYVEAMSMALRALGLTEVHPTPEDKLIILDTISNIYFELGDYDTGLEHALWGLEMARQEESPYWEAAFLGDIGYVYLKLAEPKKALTHLLHAIKFVGYTDSKFYADDLKNISQAYCHLGDYNAALDYGTRSLALYQSLGLKQDEMSALATLGQVYYAQSDYETALTHFEAALYLLQETKNIPLLIHTLNWKADIYHKMDRVPEALTIVHGALNLALYHSLKPEQTHSYKLLSDIYKQQGNYQAALVYYEKHHDTQQAMATEQTNKRLTVLEVAHEVERTRQEATLYQLRNEALEQEIAERKTVEAALRQANLTLETRTKTLEAINWIAHTAAASLDLHEILTSVTREIGTLLDVESTGIGILRDDGLEIVADHSSLPDVSSLAGATFEVVENSVLAQILNTNTGRLLDPHHTHDALFSPVFETHRLAKIFAAALRVGQQPIGLIGIGFQNPDRALTASEIQLVETVAGQIARVIVNAQLFAEVQEARAAAEAANAAKNNFMARMSHELRTPLNGVLGYTQLLKRTPNLPPDLRDGLNTIHHSGEHLMMLINDILDLSKIEADKLELRPADFHVPSFLNSLIDLFQLRAREKDLTFEWFPTDFAHDPGFAFGEVSLPLPHSLHADETRLRQVLINLLTNAIKYTDQGSIRLKVGYPNRPPTAKQVVLRFQVEDTGVGIPTDQVNDIFYPFYQVDNTGQQFQGSGLGLAISQNLLQLMGSDLHVSSTINQGSTFWFDLTLPLGSSHTSHASNGPITPMAAHQYRILVVEDDRVSRALLEHMLLDQGFQVDVATNGHEGLTLALSQRPNIILTDLLMPDMDGLEMTRHLRQIPGLQAVTIVAISANAFPEARDECLAAGCTAFLPKPIRLPQLQALLAEHLPLATPTPEPARILPPQTDLNALTHLAIIGDIDAILMYVQQLVKADSTYTPFATEIEQLARGFQIERINRLLSRYQQPPESQ